MHENSDFDQWVMGEDGRKPYSHVDEVRRQAADGSLRGFTDNDEFLTHLERRGRRSA
jgi:hypothetical protein